MGNCIRKLSKNAEAFGQRNDEFLSFECQRIRGLSRETVEPRSVLPPQILPAIVDCHRSAPSLTNSLRGYGFNCDYSLLEVVMKVGVPAAGFDIRNRRTTVYHAQISKKLQQPEAANGIGNVSFVPSALGTVHVDLTACGHDGCELRRVRGEKPELFRPCVPSYFARLYQSGVPNQSCISFSNGSTTSAGSGNSPRS